MTQNLMRKRIYFVVSFLLLSVVLVGCGGKYKRHLVEQNRQAGALVYDKALLQDVKQAGLDIQLNAEEHQEWIGKSKETQEYSPENSEAVRGASKHARENPWWKVLFKLILGVLNMEVIVGVVSSLIPGMGAIIPTALLIWKWWKASKEKACVQSLIKGVQGVQKDIKDGNAVSIKGMKDTLKAAQSAHGVWKDIKKHLASMKLKKIEDPGK